MTNRTNLPKRLHIVESTARSLGDKKVVSVAADSEDNAAELAGMAEVEEATAVDNKGAADNLCNAV